MRGTAEPIPLTGTAASSAPVVARGLASSLPGCSVSGRQEEIAPVDQYRLMAEASDAVLNGNPVPLSPADSIANMRVLDAIAASAKLGEASGCGF